MFLFDDIIMIKIGLTQVVILCINFVRYAKTAIMLYSVIDAPNISWWSGSLFTLHTRVTYTLPEKVLEYLENTMETLVFDNRIGWNWLGAKRKQVLWLECNSHTQCYGRQMQFAMSKIKDEW